MVIFSVDSLPKLIITNFTTLIFHLYYQFYFYLQINKYLRNMRTLALGNALTMFPIDFNLVFFKFIVSTVSIFYENIYYAIFSSIGNYSNTKNLRSFLFTFFTKSFKN
jgi:hypothetical protein